MKGRILQFTALLWGASLGLEAMAVPPPEDTPEEVLRQEEIITEARSPIDGRPLSASEYAELQEQIQAENRTPQLSPQVREIIFLLQVRRTLRLVVPFLIP
jgi:hypothetical protein